MIDEIAGHLADRILGAEIFAFAAKQKLLDEIVGVLGKFHWIVVARQHSRLIEAECILQVRATGQ